MGDAEDHFDLHARKLGPLQDKIRKDIYIVSAGISFHHEFFEHAHVDQEPTLRARILQQSLADFYQMMSSYENIRPKCPQCQAN